MQRECDLHLRQLLQLLLLHLLHNRNRRQNKIYPVRARSVPTSTSKLPPVHRTVISSSTTSMWDIRSVTRQWAALLMTIGQAKRLGRNQAGSSVGVLQRPNKPLKLSARVSKECKRRLIRVIYRGQAAPSLAPYRAAPATSWQIR